MTVEILTPILGLAILFMIYQRYIISKLETSLHITMTNSLINSAMIASLVKSLIEKKVLSQADIVFLKQEEDLLEKNKEPEEKK